jgi:hypothetical protein
MLLNTFATVQQGNTEGTEDAHNISKAFRTMGILCDVFQVGLQVMDVPICTLIIPIDEYTAEY